MANLRCNLMTVPNGGGRTDIDVLKGDDLRGFYLRCIDGAIVKFDWDPEKRILVEIDVSETYSPLAIMPSG